MAIKSYIGIMGSGKSYEVVVNVILPALRNGRRVVSNIAGLNYDLMRETLISEGAAESAIGELVNVPHEAILDPLFWPTDKDLELGRKPFVLLGDVVALDEIWRFWNGFSPKAEDDEGRVIRRPASVLNFIRMHRQMPHPETGITCDIAVITQDPLDMHRNLRGVIEETYLMTKLTELGMDDRYRIDIFPKVRITRKPQKSLLRKYNPLYFPLYKSHSQKVEGGADAVEVSIDKRGNILSGALFRFVIPVGLVVMCLSVWFVFRTLSPAPKLDAVAADKSKTDKPKTDKPAAPEKPKPEFETSDSWRVSGFYAAGGSIHIVLLDQGNLRVLNDPPSYKISNTSLETFLPSGEAVTSWTGGAKKSALSAVSQ